MPAARRLAALLTGGLLAATLAIAGPTSPASAANTCAADPYEPDSASAPAVLVVGTPLTRAICQTPNPFPRTDAGRDYDDFVFDARGGTAYTVTLSNLGAKVNNSSLITGVSKLNADGTSTSVPQVIPGDFRPVAVTAVLPAGRYQVGVLTTLNEVYPATNTMDIATIQGTDGAYTATVRESVAAPEVTSLALASSTVNSGKSTSGSFTLSTPAPAGGVWVYTENNGFLTVNAQSVLVPAGATRGTFGITTKRVSADTPVTIKLYTAAQERPRPSAVLTLKK